MAMSPIIETPRLRIVPFSEEHLTAHYVQWLNDPETVRFSEQRHHNHTLASCREYWQSFIGSLHYFWALELREPSPTNHIGNMNAYVDIHNLVADVGILIGERACWGGGYGTEAWVAVCNYLLYEAGMRKVTAGTIAENSGMLHIMKKTGMIEDGVRKRHFIFEGREVDLIHAALYSEK